MCFPNLNKTSTETRQVKTSQVRPSRSSKIIFFCLGMPSLGSQEVSRSISLSFLSNALGVGDQYTQSRKSNRKIAHLASHRSCTPHHTPLNAVIYNCSKRPAASRSSTIWCTAVLTLFFEMSTVKSALTGSSYGSSTPVKPLISPARAFA
jgi:hypothetical protein